MSTVLAARRELERLERDVAAAADELKLRASLELAQEVIKGLVGGLESRWSGTPP